MVGPTLVGNPELTNLDETEVLANFKAFHTHKILKTSTANPPGKALPAAGRRDSCQLA